MRIYLDANILVAVLNKEYPLFTASAKVLSLSGNKRFTLFTSPICLAIAFYFSSKKHGAASAKNRIKLLLDHIRITDCGQKEANDAIKNIQAYDFEDGLQYYSALNAKCICIITNDLADFYYSTLEVLTPDAFLQRYLSKKEVDS